MWLRPSESLWPRLVRLSLLDAPRVDGACELFHRDEVVGNEPRGIRRADVWLLLEGNEFRDDDVGDSGGTPTSARGLDALGGVRAAQPGAVAEQGGKCGCGLGAQSGDGAGSAA